MINLQSAIGAIAIVCASQLFASELRAATPEPDGSFTSAMDAYERGHFAQAYARMSALADAGNAEAARLAFQMYRYGPRLYGQSFAITDAQRRAWLALSASVILDTAPLASASRPLR